MLCYKNHIILLLLLLQTLTYCAEKVVHNNYTTNNNPTLTGANPVFNTEINPHFITNTTSIINAIGMKIGDITVLISEMAHDIATKENYEYVKKVIKQLLWQHRYHIAGGALVTSYSAISILLIADYHYLKNKIFWAYWKQESSFEDLCAIPQKELAKELMLSIGQHHYNKANPTDLAYPLIAFIKDIDEEITILKRYISTTQVIKKLHLMTAFPTNDNKLAHATKMLERSLFIKHIFLSWLADYNLTSTEKLNA